VQRRELAVDHDNAVLAHRDGDVAANSLKHLGAVAEFSGLDLDLGMVSLGASLSRRQQKQFKKRDKRCEFAHNTSPCPTIRT
jgi:hypothetical protein